MDDLLPPPEDPRPPEKDLCRLWIGNLDPKLTEYALLKILQETGVSLKHFDFLYHKTGPEKGKPRGYCFITVSEATEAVQVVNCLDGKKMLSRRLVVRLANVDNRDNEDSKKSLSTEKQTSNIVNSDTGMMSKIKAIEAKLRCMEENNDVSAFLSPNLASVAPVALLNADKSQYSNFNSENRRRKDSHWQRSGTFRRSKVPYSRHRPR